MNYKRTTEFACIKNMDCFLWQISIYLFQSVCLCPSAYIRTLGNTDGLEVRREWRLLLERVGVSWSSPQTLKQDHTCCFGRHFPDLLKICCSSHEDTFQLKPNVGQLPDRKPHKNVNATSFWGSLHWTMPSVS